MRRMFSEKQIEEIAKEYGLISVQEAISLNLLPVVRKMPAPESTTLTDEQIEMIKDGVFIEGDFLGVSNPVLFPFRETTTYYGGLLLAGNGIYAYNIVKSTKVISKNAQTNQFYDLGSVYAFNGKQVPAYPGDSGTYVLKYVNGVLTWVEEV